MSQNLNEIHSANHSVRYWRILIGPWLNFFVGALYKHYLSINSVANSGLTTNTWIAPTQNNEFVPKDYTDFVISTFSDEWNHYIYSRLIESLANIPYEIKPIPLLRQDPLRKSFASFNYAKNLLKKLLGWYAQCVPDSLNKIVFVSSYLSPLDLIRLQLSLGQIPYPYAPLVSIKEVPVDWNFRNQLRLPFKETQF